MTARPQGADKLFPIRGLEGKDLKRQQAHPRQEVTLVGFWNLLPSPLNSSSLQLLPPSPLLVLSSGVCDRGWQEACHLETRFLRLALHPQHQCRPAPWPWGGKEREKQDTPL